MKSLKPTALYHLWLGMFRGILKFSFPFFGRVSSEGELGLPFATGVLVIANHLSDSDPVLVQHFAPRPIHFFAKANLFRIPVVGFWMRTMLAFPVAQGEADRAAVRYALELLKAGEAVGIFPEGELSRDGKLLPLKAGLALIIRLSGCAVICCGIKGSNGLIPYGKYVPQKSLQDIELNWGLPHNFPKNSSAQDIMSWVEKELRDLTGQGQI